jgi:hypothetical protein
MALSPKFSNTCVNAEADALALLLNNGFLRLYDGTQATNADTALGAQVLLAELRFNATAFPAASAGVLTANALTADASANATSTATWFRALKSDGTTVVYDGSVGLSSADLILNAVALVTGAAVSVTALTISISKG